MCIILSFIVGLEREITGSTAGLRTSIIVCLGSFLFVSASFNSYDDDMMRIPSQVISGIGFLGAGIIAIDENKIKAINTAGTIWCVAAIGVLIGLKLIFEAVTGTIAIVATNIFIRKIKTIFFKERNQDNDI
jgi:putative Mg2+ transporter-C (MgtC) family protein